MTTFTNVPDSVLEPGDPIRSVDIVAIKENAVYNFENTVFEFLDSQIFTSSGTWTKPSGFDATDSVVVLAIGGGGSGGSARFDTVWKAAGGGGGGGAAIVSIPYGDVASSVTVTVGSGGASRTASNFQELTGNAGGASSFGTLAQATGGSGGGAAISNSEDVFGGEGAGGVSRPYFGNANSGGFFSGGAGRRGVTTTTTFVLPYGLTGGGGGFGVNNAGTSRSQNQTANTGRLFGDGGDGSNSTASAGSIPGGGGGGAARQGGAPASGAGARGEVRVYVVRGKVSGAELVGIGL